MNNNSIFVNKLVILCSYFSFLLLIQEPGLLFWAAATSQTCHNFISKLSTSFGGGCTTGEPCIQSAALSAVKMLFLWEIFLRSFYCSAAAGKWVTCANSERLLMKGKGWHLLPALSLRGLCLKVRQRYHALWEAGEISEDGIEGYSRGWSFSRKTHCVLWQRPAWRQKEEWVRVGRNDRMEAERGNDSLSRLYVALSVTKASAGVSEQ